MKLRKRRGLPSGESVTSTFPDALCHKVEIVMTYCIFLDSCGLKF